MVIVFEKSMSEGSVRAHTAGSWDEIKVQLMEVDTFPAVEWERARFAWTHLRNGAMIADGANVWRYFEVDEMEPCVEIFEGRLLSLSEIDPVY